MYARYLWRLESPPSEVWEIRVTEPIPQVRIFCRFSEPDSLVVTSMHTRGLLKNKDSPEWLRVMNHCVAEWDTLLPGYAPFSASRVTEYVSENCDDYDLRA